MNGDENLYQHELVQHEIKELADQITNLNSALKSLLNVIKIQQQQINELFNAINQ